MGPMKETIEVFAQRFVGSKMSDEKKTQMLIELLTIMSNFLTEDQRRVANVMMSDRFIRKIN